MKASSRVRELISRYLSSSSIFSKTAVLQDSLFFEILQVPDNKGVHLVHEDGQQCKQSMEVGWHDSVNLMHSGPGLLTVDNLSAMVHYTAVAQGSRAVERRVPVREGTLQVICVSNSLSMIKIYLKEIRGTKCVHCSKSCLKHSSRWYIDDMHKICAVNRVLKDP